MTLTILDIAKLHTVQAIRQQLDAEFETLLQLIIDIQQIPAPTFDEGARAAFIEQQMSELGLVDLLMDGTFNVYGRYPHASSPDLPPVIVSAHSDTVFPKETDLTHRRDGNRLYGPGIGDNSTGVGGILFLAKLMLAQGVAVKRPLWFVSNVGEEGLGDLNGMKAVVERFGSEATYLVVEGGLFGQISHRAIGVQRFKISVHAEGGHSWGSFGRRSAIHELGQLIAQIAALNVPQKPKTTFNVGVIEGGTSINTIAQYAHMLLDLRSEDTAHLVQLVTAVRKMVEQADKQAGASVQFNMSQIGNRPAGQIDSNHRLIRQATDALKQVGVNHPAYITSSTDANIPLSKRYEAVCIGLTESNFAHRLDEYISTEKLPKGIMQLLYLTLANTQVD